MEWVRSLHHDFALPDHEVTSKEGRVLIEIEKRVNDKNPDPAQRAVRRPALRQGWQRFGNRRQGGY